MAITASTITDSLDIRHYNDWLIFEQRLKRLLDDALVRQITPLRVVELKGEEWYLDSETGDIYVYVRPDAPILPVWHKVDPFMSSETSQVHPGDLSAT